MEGGFRASDRRNELGRHMVLLRGVVNDRTERYVLQKEIRPHEIGGRCGAPAGELYGCLEARCEMGLQRPGCRRLVVAVKGSRSAGEGKRDSQR